jgi:hypothetical protein
MALTPSDLARRSRPSRRLAASLAVTMGAGLAAGCGSDDDGAAGGEGDAASTESAGDPIVSGRTIAASSAG